MRLSILLSALLLAGCLTSQDPSGSPSGPEPPPGDPGDQTVSFSLFPASTPAGNRMTLAGANGWVAIDQPASPWTIHYWSSGDLNVSTINPVFEPSNLDVAGNKAIVGFAYREGTTRLALTRPSHEPRDITYDTAPGELVGFPKLALYDDAWVIGVPMVTPTGPIFRVFVVTNEASINDAPRFDFETAAPFSDGDVSSNAAELAISWNNEERQLALRTGNLDTIWNQDAVMVQDAPAGDGSWSPINVWADEWLVAYQLLPLIGAPGLPPGTGLDTSQDIQVRWLSGRVEALPGRDLVAAGMNNDRILVATRGSSGLAIHELTQGIFSASTECMSAAFTGTRAAALYRTQTAYELMLNATMFPACSAS